MMRRGVTMDDQNETQQQSLAGCFEEAARLLRAHPERFNERALLQVAVAAGFSVRVVRAAARESTWTSMMRDIGQTLVTGIARAVEGQAERRAILVLLAGARRGFVKNAERLMQSERRAAPLYLLDANAEGGATLTSACPSCGTIATRSLEASLPCSCGFVFAS